MSDGWLGLIDAAERFDPDKVTQFSAYARHRIKGAMLDGIRSRDPMSRDYRRFDKKLAALERETALVGRQPTDDEAMIKLGISESTLRKIWRVRRSAIVLDQDTVSHIGVEFVDTYHPDPLTMTLKREERTARRGAIARLPPRLQRVVVWHMDEGLLFKQIGRRMEITESRVCQLFRQAVDLLRVDLARSPLFATIDSSQNW